MNHTTFGLDDSCPEVVARFERELLHAADPQALLQRYQAEHPELAEDLQGIYDVVVMLQGLPGSDRTRNGDAHLGPTWFGRYRVVRRIGEGGMGVVYEALDDELDRVVAVKTLRRDATSHRSRVRFDRERQTLAQLHHTNIVPIYDTGTEGDLLYFVMPCLSGASLRQVLHTARTHEANGQDLTGSSLKDLVGEAHALSQSRDREDASEREASQEHERVHHLSPTYIRDAVNAMVLIAEGLHHAHEKGIFHRDLKPGNILVGMNGYVWVLDFGLATLQSGKGRPADRRAASAASSSDDALASLTDGPLGTPAYMAPGQHEMRPVDARTDVWGLGITLYEVLTLQRPFQGRADVLASEPRPPRSFTPCLDRDLEAVVLKCLKKGPEQRYATAQDLADDLKRWLRGEPTKARPARAPRRVWMWSKRNKGWAATLLSLALFFFGVPAAAFLMAREREQAVQRQLQVLDIEREIKGEHREGWSERALARVRALDRRADDRGTLQGLAVAALTGLDGRLDRELHVYSKHIAFAPDGQLWMVSTGQGAMRWSPETDVVTTWPKELDGPIAVRPNGAVWQVGPTYSTADRPDRLPVDPRPGAGFPLELLDVPGQKVLRAFADPIAGGSRLLSWTLSPEGSRVAASLVDAQDQQAIVVWDATTGDPLHRMASRRSPESPALPRPGLVFAPDASVLGSYHGDGYVDLWDMNEGRWIAGFLNRHPVVSVAFGKDHWLREAPRTPADRWLVATGDAHGYVSLWHPGYAGVWHVLPATGREMYSLAFSPDGTLLATSGRANNLAQIWDVATGRRLLDFWTGDYVTSLAFSPDGPHLVSSGWNVFGPKDEPPAHTRIISLERGRGIVHLNGLPSGGDRIAYSRDGQRIAALSMDWWAGVWDRGTGRLIRLMALPRGQYADNADLAFSPDGRYLATTGGNAARLWDLEGTDDREWRELPWALSEALAFVSNDRLMLLRVEVKDGSRSPDSEAPASVYPRVWVVRNLLGPNPRDPEKVLDDFAWGVRGTEAAPDGSCFVVYGRTGPPAPGSTCALRVYAPDGALIKELPQRWPADTTGGGIVFDSTGKFLLFTPYSGHRVEYYAMPQADWLGGAPGQPLAIAPDGGRWVSPAQNERGRTDLVDTDGKVLLQGLSEQRLHQVLFSPDLQGRHVLGNSGLGTLTVADLVEVRSRLTALGLGW